MVPRKEKQGLSLKAIKGENSFYQLVSGVAMGTSQEPRFKCQISLPVLSFPFLLLYFCIHSVIFFFLYKNFSTHIPFFLTPDFASFMLILRHHANLR